MTNLPEKFDIWLLWGLVKRTGKTSLLAVTNDRALAQRYKKLLESPDGVEHDWYVRIWVEPTLGNHLYGAIER